MNNGIPQNELSWLQKFFSGRNQLQWNCIEEQTANPKVLTQINPWLQKLKADHYDGPIVLPLIEENNITWYAMASDNRRFAQMIDEITAFIGPSYSDIGSELETLSSGDISENAIIERFGEQIIKFRPLPSKYSEDIEKALGLYLLVLSRRPDIQDRTRRPFGKIRSDFDCALLAGNEGGARILIEELCATGRVTAEQRKFLEIRYLKGLGRSEELAYNSTLIASIAPLSLPAQTLVDVVTALYETYVLPIEFDNDHSHLIDVFKHRIFKSYATLFRERKGVRHPIVLRAFLLSELASSEPNIARCKSILASYPEGAEGYELALQWFEGITDDIPLSKTTSKENLLNQAKQAIADEDYEETCSYCFELLPNQWAYSALLRCALELNNTELTDRILKTLATAPEAIQNELSKKDRDRLEKLRREDIITVAADKTGWNAWAEQVSKNPLKAPTVGELQDMAAKWSVFDYAQNAKRCEDLASYIANANADSESIYRDAFGVLADFFFEDTLGANRAFKAIFSTLIKVLAWNGCLSSDELEIGAQLTLALLSSGLSDHDYEETLLDLQEILKANVSPVNFDWGLNLAELLAQYPAPKDGSIRLRLFTDVVAMLRTAAHRMTLPQRNILSALAADYGCPDLLQFFPKDRQSEEFIGSDGATFEGLIGIYTLTEGAGHRAKEILQALYPKSVVEVNNDPVSTDRLISLAKSADVFVFAWKSSKHQAFYCVKQARQGQDIIMPDGKGSASILSAVMEKITGMYKH